MANEKETLKRLVNATQKRVEPAEKAGERLRQFQQSQKAQAETLKGPKG